MKKIDDSPARPGAPARDSLADVAGYYDANDEESRLGRQALEHALTIRHLERLLGGLGPEASAPVLELGAGSGRYTRWLAARGHPVVALELSERLAQANRDALARDGGRATVLAGDARDLDALLEAAPAEAPRRDFAAALVMGPFYHLERAEERAALARAAAARLRPGGLLVGAHLHRAGFFTYMLVHAPAWLTAQPAQAEGIRERGVVTGHPRDASFRGYFTTLAEAEALTRDAGLQDVRLLAQDPCIGGLDEIYNRLDEGLRAAWTAELERLADLPEVIGSGRSFLATGRKA